MQAPVYNMEGKQVGTTELPDAIFGLPWNGVLVKQVIDAESTNARSYTAHTKDRSEVSGGGKKPWRQKGTGRARHGSIRSPIWIGGGVTHGPRADRIYQKKINVRSRRKALLVSLSGKARDGEIVVLDEVVFPDGKTRNTTQMFRALASGGIECVGEKGGSVLFAFPETQKETVRALRNLPHVKSVEARMLTVRQVLGVKYLIFPKAALSVLEEMEKKYHVTRAL